MILDLESWPHSESISRATEHGCDSRSRLAHIPEPHTHTLMYHTHFGQSEAYIVEVFLKILCFINNSINSSCFTMIMQNVLDKTTGNTGLQNHESSGGVGSKGNET